MSLVTGKFIWQERNKPLLEQARSPRPRYYHIERVRSPQIHCFSSLLVPSSLSCLFAAHTYKQS